MAPRLISTGIDEMLPMVRTGDPRSHVSYIIASLCVRLGHFDTDDRDAMSDEDRRALQARFELGNAFEDAIRAGLARRYAADNPHRFVVPGEFKEDGLVGSPDLLDLQSRTVNEIKLSWMSSRHDAESEKFWKYWVQVKAYCYMVGWNVGRVLIAHVNGDYKAERKVVYRVWEDTFTDEQLWMNWHMLTTHRAELMRVVP